uniref:Uncharacterized protein n=1 Tax=mine drainage metagenome TaxID=410659 RepID=E6Q916_9ZZZZ
MASQRLIRPGFYEQRGIRYASFCRPAGPLHSKLARRAKPRQRHGANRPRVEKKCDQIQATFYPLPLSVALSYTVRFS